MDLQLLIDTARYAHILAVAAGFGAAFLADVHMLSRINRPVDDKLMVTLHVCHSIVWKSVVAMWITGLVMIGIRTGFVVENFSPKLFSKLGTVSLLTANAVLIGRFAMPIVEQSRGRNIMWLPLKTKIQFACIGAVSTTSWLLAMAMGVSKVLAASGWLTFLLLVPPVYGLAMVVASAVMFLLHIGGTMAVQSASGVASSSPAHLRPARTADAAA